jgi:methylated-DNA-[protein]-cysteine S-methyltransferase
MNQENRMLAPLTFKLEHLPSPVGTLHLVTDSQNQLHALQWEASEAALTAHLKRHYGASVGIETGDDTDHSPAWQALEDYFAGDLHATERVSVAGAGTAFQRDVWAVLRTIPVGETLSYGALAAKIGKPKAMRAVGLANGANPIAIVVPCHRVIGANKSLTGFGGGLDRKRWLLSHEGAHFRG